MITDYDLNLLRNRIFDLEDQVGELEQNFQALRNLLDAIRVIVEDSNGKR